MKNKQFLIITQMYPSGLTGTSVKTRNTIEYLLKKGHTVDVCCLHHESMIKNELVRDRLRIFAVRRNIISRLHWKFVLRAFTVILSLLPFRVKKTYDFKLQAVIDTLRQNVNYDYVFLDGFSTLQYVTAYDKKHIYVDDEDITQLMVNRAHETSNLLLKAFFWLEYWKCHRYEQKYLQYVSQVWAISQNDMNRLKTVTKAKMLVMPTLVAAQKSAFNPKAKDIVFTGLLSWMENTNGLKWFLNQWWAKIQQEVPGTKLYVVGQLADDAFKAFLASFPHVEHTGYVPNLTDIYRKSAVAIAPILINCGIKVKVVTYLSYGLPVVSIPRATWGMDSTDGIVLAEEDDFGPAVIEVLRDHKKRSKLSQQGLKNIKLHHSEKALESFFTKTKIFYDRSKTKAN